MWVKAAKRSFEAWYKIYVKRWHPELEPATTEKLVCVYSNSKMMAATCDANELKMLAWAVHQLKMLSCNVTTSDPAVHCPSGGSKPG